MIPYAISGLLDSYGFSDMEETKGGCTRFRNGMRFIDVWNGRKGITIGVYEPKTQKCWFKRKVTPILLEDILVKIS